MTDDSHEIRSEGRNNAQANEDEQPTEEIDLGSLELGASEPFRVRHTRRIEGTRSRLAFSLVALLAGTVGGLFWLIANGSITADEFQKLAGVLLAPIVGLVGAATGYYYGRGGSR